MDVDLGGRRRIGAVFRQRRRGLLAWFAGARLDTVEQLVQFLDEHGEPLLVLLPGNEIAEVLHALFRAVV